MESLPILSRNPSRNTERDWENASTASSIASVAEYTGDHFRFTVSICYEQQVIKSWGIVDVTYRYF